MAPGGWAQEHLLRRPEPPGRGLGHCSGEVIGFGGAEADGGGDIGSVSPSAQFPPRTNSDSSSSLPWCVSQVCGLLPRPVGLNLAFRVLRGSRAGEGALSCLVSPLDVAEAQLVTGTVVLALTG